MNDEPFWTRIVFPALLRPARTTYGQAMRAALARIGCDDVPRNGLYVIGALNLEGMPLAQVIRDLGVSKQAAGQLVDTLVLRGYLERSVDPEDRRRLTVTLTERGKAAAAAQAAAREAIDAELIARVGAEKVMHAREVLGALLVMGHEHDHADED
ncbi:MarR family transcriptional regulator [Sphingomonas sp.]|uniref:MarR family winged helix-turn-helix transcriptional regulator n=1 Tax=Sphingomonas sp. TaxID=28214 RepID=UPI001B09A080|nr:MarR family transcriptional regulator [Sphingomonas sp.]MBO9714913.1 MarR family transcriptional regulator [Sphingomonas sp.]